MGVNDLWSPPRASVCSPFAKKAENDWFSIAKVPLSSFPRLATLRGMKARKLGFLVESYCPVV